VDVEVLDNLEEALISSDVGLETTVREFIRRSAQKHG
jgi:signal recognition particle GTPase